MQTSRMIRMLATASLGALAAACESTTAPAELQTFDARAALQDYEAVDAIFDSEGWRGFQAIGERLPNADLAASPALTIASTTLLPHSDGHDPRRFAAEWVATVRRSSVRTELAAAPIISGFHRGRTFVYDPATDQYIVDPEREGAPATGVRFIAYREAPNGRPDPEQEIGFADLIDQGDGSVEDVALRLVVVIEERTVLDYRTTLDHTGPDGTITVDGFVQSPVDRLDFDLHVSGSDDGSMSAVDIQFVMSVATRDFEIVGALAGTEGSGETGDLDLSVRHGPHSLRVDVSGTESSVTGTFYLSEDVFATVSGHPDDPVFVNAAGLPLDFHEAAVLFRILAVVADAFQLFHDLVVPVGHLVLLGIVL